jgi:hypothetical protein
MAQHADRGAQLAILARGRIDRGKQGAARWTARRDGMNDFAMTPEERRRGACRLVTSARRRRAGPVEQQIGDAAKCGGNDHKRPTVGGDKGGRPLNRTCIGKRRAAELPDLESRGMTQATILVAGCGSRFAIREVEIDCGY